VNEKKKQPEYSFVVFINLSNTIITGQRRYLMWMRNLSSHCIKWIHCAICPTWRLCQLYGGEIAHHVAWLGISRMIANCAQHYFWQIIHSDTPWLLIILQWSILFEKKIHQVYENSSSYLPSIVDAKIWC